VRAGELDRQVEIQKRAQVQAPAGEVIDSWDPVQRLWASKRDMRASERWAANQRVAELATVWFMRWFPGWEAIRADTHRLVYRDQVFEIHGVREIGRREGIEIATVARAEGG
jgi:SPP1 family predicted phage head-tail adaptor